MTATKRLDLIASLVGGVILLVTTELVARSAPDERPSILSASENAWTLRYAEPAADTIVGWENFSLPLGNGHFGVSVFGGVEEERLQLTDKTFYTDDTSKGPNAWDRRQLTSLGDLRIAISHDEPAEGYERSLELDRAVASVRYRVGEVEYLREAFTSYPDRVLVVRFTASNPGSINATVGADIPFQDEFRTGEIRTDKQRILLGGSSSTFGVLYEAQAEVRAVGGTVQTAKDQIVVSGADELVIIATLGTNYELRPEVFLDHRNSRKLQPYPHPHKRLTRILDAAVQRSWDELLERHLTDYQNLFGRVDLQLGDFGGDPQLLTDQLLSRYKTDTDSPYLEALFFQYGRYLLIASSRKGSLPANLQGTWNAKRGAPWTGGFWANINLQMNYWPVFNTNLRETYEPFLAFFEATMPRQKRIAADQVANHNPSARADDSGWTAGTANTPFMVSGPGHVSGFGTGPFVVQNMWEYYAFTRDRAALERIWPFLHASSLFTSKIVKTIPDYGDLLLTSPSWSPELQDTTTREHYNMPGSTYDQSLIYEGHLFTLEAARILGIRNDPLLETIKSQLPRLDPIQVGTSGQIKEFRQESAYGDFGDKTHRHISQLVGLFPGQLITRHTPEWFDAARTTLELRGDRSTGWGVAHRMNGWARLGNGERAYTLLKTLVRERVLPNLWGTHPPFQIDANFGGTSGIAEMLLQSHEGYIDVLPAIPAAWSSGAFRGLVARGDIEVSAEWSEGKVQRIEITPRRDGSFAIRLDQPAEWLPRAAGAQADENGILSVTATAGRTYVLQRAE